MHTALCESPQSGPEGWSSVSSSCGWVPPVVAGVAGFVLGGIATLLAGLVALIVLRRRKALKNR